MKSNDLKKLLHCVVLFFLHFGIAQANPGKQYFAGWCGVVNAETESSVQQVCYASKAKSQETYLIVFSSHGVSEYRLEQLTLNNEKSKATALLRDETAQKTSVIQMDWFYAVPTYPGESIESYPLTLVGVTPDGRKFSFSGLKEFYNGHS